MTQPSSSSAAEPAADLSGDLPGDLQARIRELWLYPIKSCAGIQVEHCLLYTSDAADDTP